MARAIINSDDFGYNVDTNNAIALAFEEKLITSTTMLTNFDEGFVHASKLIDNNKIDKRAVGIHLNLTEGVPLSEPIKNCAKFCNGERFHGAARKQNLFKLNTHEKKCVKEELNAQLSKFLSLGFAPSHIDSHHHIHTEWGILNVVLKAAIRFNIRKVRIARNTGTSNSKLKSIYKNFLNSYISFRGYSSTEYMGDIADYTHYNSLPDSDIEIMVHALFNEKGELCDMDKQNLKEKIKAISFERHSLINFSDL